MLRAACFAMLALSAGPLLAQEPATPARPAKVAKVITTTDKLERTYPAIVLPSAEVDLSFRVSGRVIELPARGSLNMTKDEVIARLDPRDFEAQIAQLQSQRDQADAQLRALRTGARPEEIAALESSVSAAQAQVDQAREQTERARELAQRGVVTRARLEQDEANLRVAEANLQSANESLAIGRTGGRSEDIDAAEAALRGLEAQLQTARDNLDDATLRAPFDGIVARRNIENFTNLQAGQSVVLFQALATVHLAFDVPGPDVSALTVKGPDKITTTVVFDAFPDRVFEATVVEFSVQADSATQTYRGRVAVTPPEGSLVLPGMVGRVIATAPVGTPGMSVPLTAIGANPDGTAFVWVVGADNAASKLPVTLGEAKGDQVIVEGLTPDAIVIAAGVSSVREGMVIRPVARIGG